MRRLGWIFQEFFLVSICRVRHFKTKLLLNSLNVRKYARTADVPGSIGNLSHQDQRFAAKLKQSGLNVTWDGVKKLDHESGENRLL